MIRVISFSIVVLVLIGLTLANNQTKVACDIVVDLAILLESSSNITSKVWSQQKKFANELISNFGISENGSHISVIKYSNDPSFVFNLDLSSSNNVKEVLECLEQDEGNTHIDKALEMVNEKVFTEAYMRTSYKVVKVLVVMTNGRQNHTKGYNSQFLSIASQPLKDKGVHVFSLGIGDSPKKKALEEIASRSDFVVMAQSFAIGSISAKIDELKQKMCLTPCYIPMDFAILVDSSGSITHGDWRKEVQFIKDIVGVLGVSANKTHIAVIKFDREATLVVNFNVTTGSAILKKVHKLVRGRKRTYIDKALKMANETVFSDKAFMRKSKSVIKICLVMTDAKQNVDPGDVSLPLKDAAQPLKDKGVHVFTLGIGNHTSETELKAIASHPNFVMKAKSFWGLPSMIAELKQKMCSGSLRDRQYDMEVK